MAAVPSDAWVKPPRITRAFVSKVRGVLCSGEGTEDMVE